MLWKKIIISFLFMILFALSFWVSYTIFFSRPNKSQSSNNTSTSTPPNSSNPPTSSAYSFASAPTETLKATIIQKSGDVRYISRISTESAKLITDMLQQGESLVTGADGRSRIVFPASESAVLSISSQVEIIQTLPQKIILEHMRGTAKYMSPNQEPLSIRVKRLLLSLPKGEITVSYDEGKDMVSIKVLKGELIAAHNDANFTSQVQVISAGQSATFNNSKRKLTVK